MAGPVRQLWVGHVPDAAFGAELCRRREAEGFHGVNFGDSQNRYGDPYVAIALGIATTTTLKLGTLVTNPITRHPAVAAAAAGSLQAASRGRISIGIGAGDSSLAHLGVAPAPLAVFTRYVRMLRAYLAGEEVSLEDSLACLPRAGRDLPDTGTLGLARRPAVSRIRWLPGDEAPVPINVFATGPKTIDMAAAIGDRVTFSVGADPTRVRWAIDRARSACAAAGKDPDLLDCGASVVIGLDDDLATARTTIAATVATNARWAVMHGTPTGPFAPDSAAVLADVRERYDMRAHGVSSSTQTDALTDEFIDAYAIVGPAGACCDRLHELFELGLRRVHFTAGPETRGSDRVERAYRRFASDVIPLVLERR